MVLRNFFPAKLSFPFFFSFFFFFLKLTIEKSSETIKSALELDKSSSKVCTKFYHATVYSSSPSIKYPGIFYLLIYFFLFRTALPKILQVGGEPRRGVLSSRPIKLNVLSSTRKASEGECFRARGERVPASEEALLHRRNTSADRVRSPRNNCHRRLHHGWDTRSWHGPESSSWFTRS